MSGHRLLRSRRRVTCLQAVAIVAALIPGRATLRACPACIGAGPPRLTLVQQLHNCDQAVLARPASGPAEFRVVAGIKPETAGLATVTLGIASLPQAVPARDACMILGRDALTRQWSILGSTAQDLAPWLRRIAALPRTADLTAAGWRDRVGLLFADLGSDDPLVAGTAHDEVARAPYAALLTLRPRLDARRLAAAVADSGRVDRLPLDAVLLGIAGGAEARACVDAGLEACRPRHETAGLAALLVAKMEGDGSAGLAYVGEHYVHDPTRTAAEAHAAVVALGVQGTVDAAVPRRLVVGLYHDLLRMHPELAGLVATDLLAWNEPGFAPELDRAAQLADLDERGRARVAEYLAAHAARGGTGRQ